jgi:hypothetical protein
VAPLAGPATRHLGGDLTFVSITTACGNITTSRFVLTQPGAIHEGHRSLKFSRHRHGHQPFPPPCCGSSIAGSPSAHPAGSRLQYHTWLRARLITGQDTATALWLAPEDAAGQNSDWKALATANRVHSCPFVVQNHTPRSPFTTDLGLEGPSYMNSCLFVSIRGSKRPATKPLQDRSQAGRPTLQQVVPIRVHSWFKTPRSRSPSATDLGLEGPSYRKSCPFVSIRGSKRPSRSPFTTDLRLEGPRYMNSCPFVFIRGSKPHPAFHPQPQPSLHEFVVIRVHSWFKNTPLRFTRDHRG